MAKKKDVKAVITTGIGLDPILKNGFIGPVDGFTSYLHQSMGRTFDLCLDISKKKNADYASQTDPYKNFRGAERVGITVEQGIVLRMQDKMSRIENLIQRPAQVLDEKIEDTLRDLINYSAILIAYYEEKNVKNKVHGKKSN